MLGPRTAAPLLLGLAIAWLGCGDTATEQRSSGAEPRALRGPAQAPASSLERDEDIRFLPTSAALEGDTWRIPVDAWVYEPERGDLRRRALTKALARGVSLEDAEEKALRAKVGAFLVDNERGEHITVEFGNTHATLPPTGPDGRTRAVLELPRDGHPPEAQGWVELRVRMPESDPRTFSGWAQRLAPRGTSVISDIDDTIKQTHVLDKRKLLENTFLAAPRPVVGMAEAYARWAAAGASLHYVSASPLPLLDALHGFLRDAGFPRGSLALRPFRWIDGSALDLLASSAAYKQETIETLLGRFPKRRFVLIGDTGERDPEIYASVAEAHPDQVAHIYLRIAPVAPGADPGNPSLDARLEAALSGVPAQRWTVFETGAELPETAPS